jgi:hypothetical protein
VNDDGADDADAEPAPGTELLASIVPSRGPGCPVCATPRPSEGRFCEHCGADLTAEGPPPDDPILVPDNPPPVCWVAEIVADRCLYERVSPDGLAFPEDRVSTTLDLAEAEVLIGRRHERRGIEPAIDLSGPLEDPAASHRHALLTRLDDGAYALADLDSTNGTELNDGQVAIEPGRRHRLADGDRIHIGAWTTIVVRRSPS